jgi:hypothetical protein
VFDIYTHTTIDINATFVISLSSKGGGGVRDEAATKVTGAYPEMIERWRN